MYSPNICYPQHRVVPGQIQRRGFRCLKGTHTYLSVCRLSVCIYVYMPALKHAWNAHARARTHALTHARTHARTHTHSPLTYIRTHAHTHKRTYARHVYLPTLQSVHTMFVHNSLPDCNHCVLPDVPSHASSSFSHERCPLMIRRHSYFKTRGYRGLLMAISRINDNQRLGWVVVGE